MNGITFDIYMGKCEFVYKAKDPHGNGRSKIFFGDTEYELEEAIMDYGTDLEKYNYNHQEKKYYNDLFEYMEEI